LSLRACSIIHRDIKPENFVFQSKHRHGDLDRQYQNGQGPSLKLLDFGIAHYDEEPHASCRTLCGTPLYVAPEVFFRQPYSSEADMWALGVLVYTMLVGYPPFDDNDLVQLVKKIKFQAVKFDPTHWRGISPEAIDFLSNLLNKDASCRLTAQQALQHEWLRNSCRAASEARLDEAQDGIKQFVGTVSRPIVETPPVSPSPPLYPAPVHQHGVHADRSWSYLSQQQQGASRMASSVDGVSQPPSLTTIDPSFAAGEVVVGNDSDTSSEYYDEGDKLEQTSSWGPSKPVSLSGSRHRRNAARRGIRFDSDKGTKKVSQSGGKSAKRAMSSPDHKQNVGGTGRGESGPSSAGSSRQNRGGSGPSSGSSLVLRNMLTNAGRVGLGGIATRSAEKDPPGDTGVADETIEKILVDDDEQLAVSNNSDEYSDDYDSGVSSRRGRGRMYTDIPVSALKRYPKDSTPEVLPGNNECNMDDSGYGFGSSSLSRVEDLALSNRSLPIHAGIWKLGDDPTRQRTAASMRLPLGPPWRRKRDAALRRNRVVDANAIRDAADGRLRVPVVGGAGAGVIRNSNGNALVEKSNGPRRSSIRFWRKWM
jgi:serine/threonine protein kinase